MDFSNPKISNTVYGHFFWPFTICTVLKNMTNSAYSALRFGHKI